MRVFKLRKGKNKQAEEKITRVNVINTIYENFHIFSISWENVVPLLHKNSVNNENVLYYIWRQNDSYYRQKLIVIFANKFAGKNKSTVG